MNLKRALRPAGFLIGLAACFAANANCFNLGTVWCDGVVRALRVTGGKVFVSLGSSIGGGLGCGTFPAPPGAAAAEYVTIDPAQPHYAEKYQAALVASTAASNVLVYLIPDSNGGCTISEFLIIP